MRFGREVGLLFLLFTPYGNYDPGYCQDHTNTGNNAQNNLLLQLSTMGERISVPVA
jgi:hypothetical protein